MATTARSAQRLSPTRAATRSVSEVGVPVDELVLSTAARSLRRALGPTAWVVLEELTSEGTVDGDATTVVVATNVRGLAEALGLGRDAVAGALQALGVAGWVRSEPARSSGGRFAAGRYLVATNPALRRVLVGPTVSSHRPSRSPKTPTPRPEQLTLLELTPTLPPTTTATSTATSTATATA